jgi:hypothetical protein
VRRGVLGGLILALGLAATPPRTVQASDCVRQSQRVRLPTGFAQARLAFAGVLDGGQIRVGEEFPGNGLRELRITVEWTEIEHVHHHRLQLLAPDGTLYQRFTGSFTGDHRRLRVVTGVPVAGSAIVDAGLYGEWCAEVFVDDDDAPIARRHFILTP